MRYCIAALLCLSLAACATTRPKISGPPQGSGDVVVFPKLSTKITPAAAAVINRIASEANSQPDKIIEVIAPPSRQAPGYDAGLVAPRIVIVEHALIAAGVPAKRIARRTLAATPEGADPSGSQRFDLRLVLNRTLNVSGARKHAAIKRENYIH
jgi:hypothetical protein